MSLEKDVKKNNINMLFLSDSEDDYECPVKVQIDWSKVPVTGAFKKQEDYTQVEEQKGDCPCDDWKYDTYGELRICIKCNRVIEEGVNVEPEPVYRDNQYRAPSLQLTPEEMQAHRRMELFNYTTLIIDTHKDKALFKLILPFIEPALKQVVEYRLAYHMKRPVAEQCLVCEIASRCTQVQLDHIRQLFGLETINTGKRLLADIKSRNAQNERRLAGEEDAEAIDSMKLNHGSLGNEWELARQLEETVAAQLFGKPILNIQRVSFILELYATHHDHARCRCAKFKGARTQFDINCHRVIKELATEKLALKPSNAAKLVALTYKILYDPIASKELQKHSPAFNTLAE